MIIECTIPETLSTTVILQWKEEYIPLVGDALYISQFLNETDTNLLKEIKHIQYENLFKKCDQELAFVIDRSWLKDDNGNTICLLITNFEK